MFKKSRKKFWWLMWIITVLSLIFTVLFGSEIPWNDLSKCFFIYGSSLVH